MAVWQVGLDYRESGQSSCDAQGVRTYKDVWNVRCNSPLDIGPVIFNAAGIPVLFSPYPADPWAYLINKSAQRHSSWDFWKVSLDYNTKIPFDPTQADENPLNRPPIFRVSTNKLTKIVTEDADGLPYLNSAGDPFEGGVELADSRAFYSITWNADLSSLPDHEFMKLQNKVNSDTYRGFIAGRLLVCDVTSEYAFENGVGHYKRTAQVEDKEDGWNPVRRLDQGYRAKGMQIKDASNVAPIDIFTNEPHNLTTDDTVHITGVEGNTAANGQNWVVTVIDSKAFSLNGSTGNGAYVDGTGYIDKFGEKPQMILERGQPITSPALLDGNGHRLRTGADAVYRENNDYQTMSFASLP